MHSPYGPSCTARSAGVALRCYRGRRAGAGQEGTSCSRGRAGGQAPCQPLGQVCEEKASKFSSRVFEGKRPRFQNAH